MVSELLQTTRAIPEHELGDLTTVRVRAYPPNVAFKPLYSGNVTAVEREYNVEEEEEEAEIGDKAAYGKAEARGAARDCSMVAIGEREICC